MINNLIQGNLNKYFQFQHYQIFNKIIKTLQVINNKNIKVEEELNKIIHFQHKLDKLICLCKII